MASWRSMALRWAGFRPNLRPAAGASSSNLVIVVDPVVGPPRGQLPPRPAVSRSSSVSSARPSLSPPGTSPADSSAARSSLSERGPKLRSRAAPRVHREHLPDFLDLLAAQGVEHPRRQPRSASAVFWTFLGQLGHRRFRRRDLVELAMTLRAPGGHRPPGSARLPGRCCVGQDLEDGAGRSRPPDPPGCARPRSSRARSR